MNLPQLYFLLSQGGFELLGAGPDGFLCQFRFGDIVGEALDEQRPAILVSYDLRLRRAARAPCHGELARGTRRERAPCHAATRELVVAQFAVIGVQLIEPEKWIAQPLFL